MDLHVPSKQNFKKFVIDKKYYNHSLKEHPKFSKTAKCGCEMFRNVENIALQSWQILYYCS